MSRWIPSLSLSVALVALGCSDDAGALMSADVDGGTPPAPDATRDDGGPTDMGDLGVECGPGQISDGVACLDVPDDPCALTDPALGAGCVDADGDCFPDKCDDPIPAYLLDCDDMNADRRPGLLERCDGIDNDCDGVADEGLGLGEACEACDRGGLIECGVDGATACSVEAGQSEALVAEETCDGADEDCDGRVDEGCALALPDARRRAPRWCGDRVLWIADDALVAYDLPSGEVTVLDDGPVAAPTCAGERAAWLRTMGCEGGGIGAPLICAGAQLVLDSGGDVRPLAPFGELGAPALAEDGVYVHEGRAAPVVLWAPFDGTPAEVIARDVSDPTAPVDDLLVARATRGERLVMEGVGINRPSRTLDAPGQASPGRPVRDAALIAWIAGEAPVLWVLPAASLGQGVQVGPAVDSVPWITPDAVWWRAPDGLRRFDVQSGDVALVMGDAPSAAQLWVGPEGRAVVTDDALRLWPTDPGRFAEPEPDPEPEPDAGALDASVDAGLPAGDADVLDAAPMDGAP